MLKFFIGVVIGIFITMLCIGIWAVYEEDNGGGANEHDYRKTKDRED